jgi:hypothetical protein
MVRLYVGQLDNEAAAAGTSVNAQVKSPNYSFLVSVLAPLIAVLGLSAVALIPRRRGGPGSGSD